MALPDLARVKDFLNISWDDDDTLITSCLNAAVRTVERHTGTSIGQTVGKWYSIPYNAKQTSIRAQRFGEFESPSALSIRGVLESNAPVQHTASTGFSVLGDEWLARIFIDSAIWDAFRAAAASAGSDINTGAGVELAITAGRLTTDIPDDWALCILQLAAEAYSNRHESPSADRLVSSVYLRRISPRP